MAQFTSIANVANGECLGAYEDAHLACTTEFGVNTKIPGTDTILVPLGGGNVTNLQAFSKAAPGAGKSSTVEVRDNGTTILSCTVAENTNTCSAAGGVAVAAGHYLQVKITTTAGGTGWRVAFRY